LEITSTYDASLDFLLDQRRQPHTTSSPSGQRALRFVTRSAPSQYLVRLCGHELVQPGIAGEAVLKGDNIPRATDEAAACRDVGDVAELGFGNVQQGGQLIPVGFGLIQKDEEFRIGQHETSSVGTKQFLHVLR